MDKAIREHMMAIHARLAKPMDALVSSMSTLLLAKVPVATEHSQINLIVMEVGIWDAETQVLITQFARVLKGLIMVAVVLLSPTIPFVWPTDIVSVITGLIPQLPLTSILFVREKVQRVAKVENTVIPRTAKPMSRVLVLGLNI